MKLAESHWLVKNDREVYIISLWSVTSNLLEVNVDFTLRSIECIWKHMN